jgi:tetratricopeptide (TPR) repeat protein
MERDEAGGEGSERSPELEVAPKYKLALPPTHPALRWPLAALRWLAVLALIGLIVDAVHVYISNGPERSLAAAHDQLLLGAGLIAANPATSAAAGGALLVLIGLAILADRQADVEVARRKEAAGRLRAEVAAREAAERELPAPAGEDAPRARKWIVEDMRAAARAGELIGAMTPGVPVGVVAPEGLPRVGRLEGRDATLDDALNSLTGGSSLAISALNGLPGVGRTVFAAEVVARAGERGLFPGGTVWLSCEGQSGDSGLEAALTRVARAIGDERAATEDDSERRSQALYASLHADDAPRLLLALDNVEPTLNATALLDILAGGRATLLLTARQPIEDARLTGFSLGPLEAAHAEALFRLRLRQGDPARPNSDDEPLTHDVVEAVGGLPLAIDLTAAFAALTHQPLEEAARDARDDGLRGPLAGLRARVDRSWAALGDQQRRLLAGLSLVEGATFPRGVALAVAGAVLSGATDGRSAVDSGADGEAWREPAAESLDALIGLRLVEALAAARLRLHPMIRQYVAARLREYPEEERDALGATCAAWWLAYARAHLGGDGADALEAEAAGLMGAITWARARARHRTLLDLTRALSHAWSARGRLEDERQFRPWAVEAARALDDAPELRLALHELAASNARAGRILQARAGFAEALSQAREMGDAAAIQLETYELALRDGQTGHGAEARAGYEEALRLARALDDKPAIAKALLRLGARDLNEERIASSRERFGEAAAIISSIPLAMVTPDELAWMAETERRMAELERRHGDKDSACAGFRRALTIYERIGDPEAEVMRRRLRELECAP